MLHVRGEGVEKFLREDSKAFVEVGVDNIQCVEDLFACRGIGGEVSKGVAGIVEIKKCL
jgi:hypothetical protein